MDFDKYVVTGGTFVAEGLAKIGGFALNVALSFILSFLLLLEKDRIHKFGLMMQDSKIGSVYGYMRSMEIQNIKDENAPGLLRKHEQKVNKSNYRKL